MMLPRGLLAADVLPTCDHVALLADTHISGGIRGGMAKRLSTVVSQILSLPNRPQRVLIAGDCAHLTGQASDYREYARRIQPLTAVGMPLHTTLGNHDQRERFWNVLPAERRPQRQSMFIEGRNANWLLLDSLNKTNVSAGELGSDQLDWLAAMLDARANKPALVMLHHDPIRDSKKKPDGALTDSDRLLAIVRPRRQVKAIFWGHTHRWSVSRDYSGIHLINLPATGYTLWGRSFLGWASCQIYRDDAILRIHSLDPERKENGLLYPLRWRV